MAEWRNAPIQVRMVLMLSILWLVTACVAGSSQTPAAPSRERQPTISEMLTARAILRGQENAVDQSDPNLTATPSPNFDATVVARVQATVEALVLDAGNIESDQKFTRGHAFAILESEIRRTCTNSLPAGSSLAFNILNQMDSAEGLGYWEFTGVAFNYGDYKVSAKVYEDGSISGSFTQLLISRMCTGLK